ncbi:cation channel sperm-associated protein 1-like [Myripristis murdjan]|uniref:cation channel sperm-associated protein 1-like n=1 Tax=Myripristis murdjan TaxID=586833 RepID=UPI0011762FC1|nr:cation channel sperm-associated protein 1 [Myripristis murdjan]
MKVLRRGLPFIRALRRFVDHRWFDATISAVIIINVVALLVETWDEVGPVKAFYLDVMEKFFCVIYTLECVLKLLAHGLDFFKEGWNWFVLVIVITSLLTVVPVEEDSPYYDFQAMVKGIKSIRGARAAQAFRILTQIRSLRCVLDAIFEALGYVTVVIGIMMALIYTFSIPFRVFFGQSDPDHFGSICRTWVSLFAVLTLDDWGEIFTINKASGNSYVILILWLYIYIMYYLLINLVLAVFADHVRQKLCERDDSQQQQEQDEAEDEAHAHQDAEPQYSEAESESQDQPGELLASAGETADSDRSRLRLKVVAVLTKAKRTNEEARVLGQIVNEVFDTFLEAFEEDEVQHEEPCSCTDRRSRPPTQNS